MGKAPSFQFYPGDWMKDPALRSVSLAARGLWIDTLCLLFESDRRGYLQHITGKPVTDEQLARMTGCPSKQVSRLLQELENSGVFSRNEHGVIYSRRMLRDEHIRRARAEGGKAGGNPALLKDKLEVNHTDNLQSNLPPTPSSSSSSSGEEKSLPLGYPNPRSNGTATPPDPPGPTATAKNLPNRPDQPREADSGNDLLVRLVKFVGGAQNLAFFQKAVKALGNGRVEEAFSDVKDRIRAGKVKDAESYLTTVLKREMEAVA